jgi:predicted O-methyltransferase YrrM
MKQILDTGTHYGISAAYMGQALKDNSLGGIVDSYEISPEYAKKARQLWIDLGLTNIRCFEIDFLKNAGFVEEQNNKWFQLVLLDTEPQLRFAELIKIFPYVDLGGFIFIHDLHRHMSQGDNQEHGFGWPFGKLPDEIIQLVKDDELRPWHFPTPRGLAGFYKTDPRDFKWL